MACFIMKALTLDNGWFEFSIFDAPTLCNDEEFVLLNKPLTPKLLIKTIRRGDPETRLFEGDVITFDGCDWMVCYERGFYVINKDYVSKHFYQLPKWKYKGVFDDVGSPVPPNLKHSHLFKYNDVIFRLNDITGFYDNKLIIRPISELVKPSEIKQECSLNHKGKRIYLGDVVDGMPVVLHHGRIALQSPDGYTDIITGGEIKCLSSPIC